MYFTHHFKKGKKYSHLFFSSLLGIWTISSFSLSWTLLLEISVHRLHLSLLSYFLGDMHRNGIMQSQTAWSVPWLGCTSRFSKRNVVTNRVFFGGVSFFLGLFFRAVPAAYGGSQARGLTGAVAAGLHHSHSHSNTGSKPRLQPTPRAHSNARSLAHWARPGIKPTTSWFLVGFINHWATVGIPTNSFREIDFQILNFPKMDLPKNMFVTPGRLSILYLTQPSLYFTRAKCTHQQSPTLLWNCP